MVNFLYCLHTSTRRTTSLLQRGPFTLIDEILHNAKSRYPRISPAIFVVTILSFDILSLILPNIPIMILFYIEFFLKSVFSPLCRFVFISIFILYDIDKMFPTYRIMIFAGGAFGHNQHA